MNQQLELLSRLQKKDILLSRMECRIQSIPNELKALEADLNTAKNEVEKAKKSSEEDKKGLRLLESEVTRLKDNLSKARQKLPDVKTNKEYTALLAEIESIEKSITVAEDKELELMEELESNKKVIPEKEALLKEEESKFSDISLEKGRELGRVKSEFSSEAAKRDELKTSIETNLLSMYNSLFENKDGIAVCNLEGDTCRGCDMEVPPQFAIDVRKGDDVLCCPQCGRVLYFKSEDKS